MLIILLVCYIIYNTPSYYMYFITIVGFFNIVILLNTSYICLFFGSRYCFGLSNILFLSSDCNFINIACILSIVFIQYFCQSIKKFRIAAAFAWFLWVRRFAIAHKNQIINIWLCELVDVFRIKLKKFHCRHRLDSMIFSLCPLIFICCVSIKFLNSGNWYIKLKLLRHYLHIIFPVDNPTMSLCQAKYCKISLFNITHIVVSSWIPHLLSTVQVLISRP